VTYVQRVNLAIDYIVGRLAEPLRLRDLARAAMLSPFHFHRVFQSLVGSTPADFVQRLRLEHALAMLSRPRPPSLTAIALACGFSSSSDFSRCFKRRFGVPPSAFDLDAWRRTHGAELEAIVERATARLHLKRLPPRHNPDSLRVGIRELPARTVAYIRVDRPYQGDRVMNAAFRLLAWAERNGLADGQWDETRIDVDSGSLRTPRPRPIRVQSAFNPWPPDLVAAEGRAGKSVDVTVFLRRAASARYTTPAALPLPLAK
jgi:AraC family transcriptional regulator